MVLLSAVVLKRSGVIWGDRQMKRPGIPATLWFLAFVVVSYLYIDQLRKAGPSEFIFSEKFYYEAGNDALYVTGTMTGPGIAYPDNAVGLTCYRDRNYCSYTSVYAIGANHIGRMDPPHEYEIVKWDDNEIIAEDQSMFDCQKITITIARKSQQIAWVEEPINQTEPNCVNSTTAMAKYTIESSPGWKRIYGEGK
jgi:hypothetical protein